MVEPEKKGNSASLEDTVRNLREENAKLMQLLRSQGLILDTPPTLSDGKSTEPSNIIFDNSNVTLTNNSINTTNQITHQHVHNHGPVNQQNYSGQTIHGNQSNITPNFNTIIQTTTQPFVQNNSNTLVQNNTNLIQPINLVNFNNVSLDSIQSFFASQNNLLYLSQPSSSSTTTTITTTQTTTTTTASNINNESEQHQISIRPKPSIIPQQHQDLVSVLPKVKSEHLDYPSRQLSSSSNSETTNLLDNDLNHKQPRPIRPKPSSRSNSLQIYTPVVHNEIKSTNANVLTPSLLTNTNPSSTVSLLSPSTSFDDHHMDLSPQLLQTKSVDLSIPPTNNLLTSTKKPTKNLNRNRKKPSTTTTTTATSIIPSTTTITTTTPPINPSLIPIAPNPGRPLAPAPLNVQRIVTTNKRSVSNKKRNSKTIVQYHSESILQTSTSSSPPNSFAESISGLMQNFDQELLASNFLSQPATTNILSNDSPNVNLIRTLDNIDVRQIVSTTIQRPSDSTPYQSMPTLDEFHDRLDHDTNQTIQDYNVDNEQLTSFMNDDEMNNFVEMNFDENTFLKQFDLDDSQIKLNTNPEQNIFGSLLTNNHHMMENTNPIPSHPPPPPPPMYPGSSLINNNVFTTVVPLGSSQQQSSSSSQINSITTTRCLPEEGVQLTARHIEPSQVATYESVKYQDILDDLVTVTDQDVLTHVQAAAANDTTDFSFALLEATNEIIKTTEMQVAEETATAFVDLQYFYPIEQEQELLQQQLEECDQKQEQEQQDQPHQEHEQQQQQEEEILPSAESPKSNEDLAITDLASIIQINQTRSPSPIKDLLPPPSSSLPPPPPPLPPVVPVPPPPPPPPISIPPPPPTPPTTSYETTSAKPCIIFEPILSPTQDELVLESGCVTNHSIEKSDLLEDNNIIITSTTTTTITNNNNNNDQIEDLLDETTTPTTTPPKDPYEIIENEGQASPLKDVTVDNIDYLIEQIEKPPEKILEKNFYHYQKVYQDNLKKKPKEQYSPIPSVKLKLNSIYIKHKKKRKSSPSPVRICENVRPPLKIKIRTKLASPPPPPPKEESPPRLPPVPKIKIRKPIKKLKRKKVSSPSIDDQIETEAKLSLKTEYAGLTRFEQPLAQRYHQQSSPDTRIPPTPGENEDLNLFPNKQDTPPPPAQPSSASSSSTTMTTLNSSSPMNQNKKLTHLLNYDDEPLNNNTFITPPPETDAHIQHHKHPSQNYQSPKKTKKPHQNSFHNKDYYATTRQAHVIPPPPAAPPPQPSSLPQTSLHMDPYAQSFHHFDPRTTPFFNFPFTNPFMNPHPTTTTHFHPNAMKYHYPTHQQQYPYHPHLQRQQQYNNPNYMSSHDHHSYNR